MAKAIAELIADVKSSNDAYHEALTELMCCETLEMEQRVKIGSDALKIYDLMATLNVYIEKLA